MQSKDEKKQPFPWNDCILKLCFLLQFVAFVLSGIAFFSPFWYVDLNREIRAGLWGRCDRDLECIWFFERSYAESLPGAYTVAGMNFKMAGSSLISVIEVWSGPGKPGQLGVTWWKTDKVH